MIYQYMFLISGGLFIGLALGPHPWELILGVTGTALLVLGGIYAGKDWYKNNL